MALNATTRKEIDNKLDEIEACFKSDNPCDRTMAAVAFASLVDNVTPKLDREALIDKEKLRSRKPYRGSLRFVHVTSLALPKW